jgi:acyl carrier protein
LTARERIRDYVHGTLLDKREPVRVEDDASLIKSGLINSLAIVELISFVERTFGISVADRDIEIDDFDSVNTICSMIDRRRAGT